LIKKTALKRINPEDLDQLLHPVFDSKAKKKVIAKGLNASPGAAVGKVVFHADEAVKLKEQKGENTILVRIETSPEDIKGMDACKGILTARGGATSHAAVVARGMGKCCVAGCGDVLIDYKKKQFVAGMLDPEEALKLLDTESFDLILSDIKMPKIQGTDLFFKVKKIDPFVQLIIMTGYPVYNDIVNMLESGVSDFLIKPFDLEETKNIVKETLARIDRWRRLKFDLIKHKKYE